jgi:hypothetical protein
MPSAAIAMTPTSDPAYPIPKSTQFANECMSYLVSPNFLIDGIISQTEFTRFIMHHCIEEGLCDDTCIITFEELGVSLQLEFILGVCHHDDEREKSKCIQELNTMWRSGNEFGFSSDADQLDVLVSDLCSKSFGYVLSMGYASTPGETRVSVEHFLFIAASQSTTYFMPHCLFSPNQSKQRCNCETLANSG